MTMEIEIGDWITPKRPGRLYRVTAFTENFEVFLSRFPLNEHVTVTRPVETLQKNWRPVYSTDWIRDRKSRPS